MTAGDCVRQEMLSPVTLNLVFATDAFVESFEPETIFDATI